MSCGSQNSASIGSASTGEGMVSVEIDRPRSAPIYDADDLLTVAVAADIAARSVRTIRRAYRRGALVAHRDGNGRTVRIRYGDLRGWMMAKPAAFAPAAGRPLGEVRHHKKGPESRSGRSRNLQLLDAAWRRRAA
jgi:excisionase family DNA binding protein